MSFLKRAHTPCSPLWIFYTDLNIFNTQRTREDMMAQQQQRPAKDDPKNAPESGDKMPRSPVKKKNA
ncbi:hypothetical protein [Paramixta manurensis]|uniref:hypothetical protein n=1 Tax=Paramixta manurensis TaxID=2740817 RepID=UPI00156AA5B6